MRRSFEEIELEDFQNHQELAAPSSLFTIGQIGLFDERKKHHVFDVRQTSGGLDDGIPRVFEHVEGSKKYSC